jgi:hypothetical protein
MSSFSQRRGYSGLPKEITVREDAPESIRAVALDTASTLGLSGMREIVCRILRIRPSPHIWSEEAVWREVEYLVYRCEWFKVYDIIEAFAKALMEKRNRRWQEFYTAINECFVEEGIGWQLVNGEVVTRGDEAFEGTIKTAVTVLEEAAKPTAAGHIKFATSALSARPTANTSGAVAHATSAVECVLGAITGQSMTLGQYLGKNPGLFHPALKKGLDGIYGYASDEGARHGKEGTEPSREDAEFVVATCAAACTLLTRKHSK